MSISTFASLCANVPLKLIELVLLFTSIMSVELIIGQNSLYHRTKVINIILMYAIYYLCGLILLFFQS